MTPRSGSQEDSGDDRAPRRGEEGDRAPQGRNGASERSAEDASARTEDHSAETDRATEDDRHEDEDRDEDDRDDDSERGEGSSGPRGRTQERSSPERRERTGSFAAGFGQTLPMALVGVFLLVYFVWLCSEMGSHAHDGLSIVIGTFAGILLGILAAAVAMGLRALSVRGKGDRDG